MFKKGDIKNKNKKKDKRTKKGSDLSEAEVLEIGAGHRSQVPGYRCAGNL